MSGKNSEHYRILKELTEGFNAEIGFFSEYSEIK